MTRLVMMVPTRCRPHAVVPLAEAFAATCTAATWLTFCLDGYDGGFEDYAVAHAEARSIYSDIGLIANPRRRLVGTLNHHAADIATHVPEIEAIGYLGDDHRPRSVGWDTRFLDTLTGLGTGIVYGDDGHHGEDLPTAAAMTVDIVRLLGYMAPPTLVHMYCDNFWRDLGTGAGCLRYLPDVHIEHLHPSFGKAAWDDSYLESNHASRYAADKAAYRTYQREQMPAAVDVVKTLRTKDVAL